MVDFAIESDTETTSFEEENDNETPQSNTLDIETEHS